MPIRLLVKAKVAKGDRPPQEVEPASDLVSLGRDKGCDVYLADQAVSRRHAQIIREGALYFLEDVGSSFGTRVNGVELPQGEKRLLKSGDAIQIGPFEVVFERVAEPAADRDEKTSFVAKRAVKGALRGLATAADPCLRVMNGPLEGKRFEVGDAQELVIGRDANASVVLDEDDLASRRHAKVRRDWSGTTIEDLGSRNGILVNGKKVKSQALKDRDEIEIGGTRFLFLDPTEAAEPSVPPPRASKAVAPAKAPPKRVEPEEPAEEPPEDEPAEEPPEEDEGAGAGGEEGDPPAEEPPSPEEGEEAGEPGEEAGEGEGEDGDGAGDEEPSADEPYVPPPREEPEEPAPQSLAAALASREGLRNLLPVLVVGGIAICALIVLAITFVVT